MQILLAKDGLTGLGDDVNLQDFKSIIDLTKLEFTEANKE